MEVKRRRDTLLTLALLCATCVTACGWSDPCGNSIRATAPSPSGRAKAVVFVRDCGATTGYSTQVSVLPARAEFLSQPTAFRSTEAGNALVVGEELSVSTPANPGQLSVSWEGDALVLEYPAGLKVFTAPTSVARTTVVHRHPGTALPNERAASHAP
jgi:hypothetical protein